MARRPSNTSQARVDPNTGRALSEGIRWRADRKRYQIRVTVADLVGNKQHRSRMYLTLAEAKREIAKEASGRNPNAGMMLTQWHERYWPAVAASVRVSTARGYDVSWCKRGQPALRDKKLEEITSPLIESAIVSWVGSPSIKVDSLAVLSRLLDGARRARIIDYKAACEVKRPSQDTSSSPTSRALTAQQIRKLLELIEPGVYRHYAALVFTGMRAGGATAQLVRDADLGQGILHISRSFSPGKNGELIEQSPKSHKEREAPITKQLRPFVVEAIKGKEPDDLLWAGPNGGRLTGRNFRRAVDWEKFKTEHRRPDLRVHDLRHTFATPSPRSSSTQVPLHPMCKPHSGTPACKSPNATHAPARASRGAQGRCSTGSSSQTSQSRRRAARQAARRGQGARLRARTWATRSAIRSELLATVRAARMVQEWPKVAAGSAGERRDGSCDRAQD